MSKRIIWPTGILLLSSIVLLTIYKYLGAVLVDHVVGGMIIIIALADIVIWILYYITWRQHRDVAFLEGEVARLTLTVEGAIMLGGVGVNIYFQHILPPGLSGVLLVLGLIAMSYAPLFLLIQYVRAGWA
jgi:F0F1-type ATP synthase assembly protein I